MNKFIEEIKNSKLGKIEENISLKKYTTYKIGGRARLVVYPKDTKSLITLLKKIKEYSLKYKILGNGSNLIFSDKDYDGVLIKLDCFDDISVRKNYITVGAGYSLMRLCLFAAKKDLAGLEFAAGIPGTVGGAVFMNAGAYKSDMGYVVKKVKVLTPDYKVITMSNKELDFHYRSSFFQKNLGYICLEATFCLTFGKKEAIMEVIKDRRERRMESQPLEYPSAGSVFRNPDIAPAGKIIEDMGFKGLTKGGAQISVKHANFIINIGNARAQDVKELIDFVKEAVYDAYGVELKVEQEFVNWE